LEQVNTYNTAMDYYAREQLMREAHRTMIRIAEERSRLLAEPTRVPLRWWVAGRLRALADRLDGRPAPKHLRVVQ
jgi:pentatricopeptide repeat protein